VKYGVRLIVILLRNEWLDTEYIYVVVNYGPNRLGRSVYGPYPFFWCSRGVSVSV